MAIKSAYNDFLNKSSKSAQQGWDVGKDANGRAYKAYKIAADGTSFRYMNPDSLTDKQRKVVMDFVREVEGELAFNEQVTRLEPLVDLIFMLKRGEITYITFNKVCKLAAGFTLDFSDPQSPYAL